MILLGVFDATEGNTFAFKVESGNLVSVDGKGLKVPAKHFAKNVGATTYREILIETKNSKQIDFMNLFVIIETLDLLIALFLITLGIVIQFIPIFEKN